MPTAEEDEESRSSRALIAYATTTTDDLYALLSLPAPSPTVEPPTAAQLKRTWRSVALQWHPDRNRGNEAEAATRLVAARKAVDVLSDPAARQAYDDRQKAKREKVEREGKFEEKRRRMKEDLERRESGGGVGWDGGVGTGGKRKGGAETEAERREREVRRLAADGARRRVQKEEQMRREREAEIEERLASGKAKKRKTDDVAQTPSVSSACTPTRNANVAPTSNPTTPSFSFKKSVSGTPAGGGTPSLFEATMARLRAKEAEKRELEAEIRREDESEGAAPATTAVADAAG